MRDLASSFRHPCQQITQRTGEAMSFTRVNNIVCFLGFSVTDDRASKDNTGDTGSSNGGERNLVRQRCTGRSSAYLVPLILRAGAGGQG